MQRLSMFLAVTVGIVLASNALWGSIIAAHLINERTILGTWEAISDDDVRVFRMEISQNSKVLFAYAIENGVTWVYHSDNFVVKNGAFTADVQELKGNSRVEIGLTGSGSEDGSYGELRGSVVIKPVNNPPKAWEVRFVKVNEMQFDSYIKKLYHISQKAESAIKSRKCSFD